jgi:hypothetical protein
MFPANRNFKVKATVLISALWLLFSTNAFGQALPETPAPAAYHRSIKPLSPLRPPLLETAKTKIVSRPFLLLSGAAVGAAVLDIESTAHCLANDPSCRDINPLFGNHPSRARLYGISMGVLGAQIFSSYSLRRAHPHSKLWMAPLVVGIGVHSVAASLNFSHF